MKMLRSTQWMRVPVDVTHDALVVSLFVSLRTLPRADQLSMFDGDDLATSVRRGYHADSPCYSLSM